MEESGRRLKQLRGKKRLREICEQVDGLKEQRLSNWEQGIRMISVDEAKKLAPVLGTSAEYILTLTDKAPDPQEVELLALFRACDVRGRLATLNTAQQQAVFVKAKDTPESTPFELRMNESTTHDPIVRSEFESQDERISEKRDKK